MPGSEVHFHGGGFILVTGERWGDVHYALFLPAWFVFLISTILPCARLAFARNTRSNRPGCCRFCGYDLRATPSRCPECGTGPKA